MEVNIGPAWYGTPEAYLFVTYACTVMLAHTHTQSRTVTVLQSQVARLLTSSKSHNRAKAGRTTGTEYLIMSASAVFVTQTAGHCYWGPGRNTQCKPCTLINHWSLDRRETLDSQRMKQRVQMRKRTQPEPDIAASFWRFPWNKAKEYFCNFRVDCGDHSLCD